jgi:hypothetical protein
VLTPSKAMQPRTANLKEYIFIVLSVVTQMIGTPFIICLMPLLGRKVTG